jgi:hypothetical protein
MPNGINLAIEFMKQFVGMKYGHVNMCMDKVTDCAEFIRITLYIFTGKDIGNSSHSQYINPEGKIVCTIWSELYKCRFLTVAFYDTDNKSTSVRKAGEDHVAVVYDSKHLIQSGASYDTDGRKLYGRVAITDIKWHPKLKEGHFLYAKDFLTDNEYNSLIKGRKEENMTAYDNGPVIAAVQNKLFEIGAPGNMIKEFVGEGGPNTADAVRVYKRSRGLPDTADIDYNTLAALLGEPGNTEELIAITAKYNGLKARVIESKDKLEKELENLKI